MGVINNISATSFPKQGRALRRRVKVCFHYDTTQTIGGMFVRDDKEDPFIGIIRLDDGRHVLDTECQYTFLLDK